MRRIMEEVGDVEVAGVVPVIQVVEMEKKLMIMTPRRSESLAGQVVVATKNLLFKGQILPVERACLEPSERLIIFIFSRYLYIVNSIFLQENKKNAILNG